MLRYQFSRSSKAAIQFIVHGDVFRMHKSASVARSGCGVALKTERQQPEFTAT
jgi:hypothetical protein